MMPFAPRRKMVVSSLGCAFFMYLLLAIPNLPANASTTVAVNPVFTATVNQSSCTAGIPNNDASIRITSLSDGDRVNYSVGNTYTGNPDYSNAQIIGALPFTIASGLTNPMGTRDYTIRVFNGDSGTFTDVLVTLDEKICPNECSCVDYLYVNDPTLDLTHKFPLNPDGTVGPEVGSPWMPTGNITNPHGVVGDLNGNLYIAQIDVTPTQLYQVSCDGTILNSNAIPSWNRTLNLVTDENTIYSIGRAPGGGAYHVYAHDICSGALINSIMLPDGGTAGWGLSKGEDDELYFTMSFANIAHAHTIYHVEKDLSAYNLVWSLPQISGYNTHGVDQDEYGNFYVVLTRNSPGATTIYKIGPGGNTINTISDNSLNGTGFGGTWGIVYNATNGKLYMGTLGDDCVAVVDAGGQFGNMTYEAASGVGHVPGTYSKAINIVRECCPNNVSFTLDTVVCGVPFGDEVHLSRLISCDNGVFCEGNWSVGPGNSGINYDPCNQTISFNAMGACGEFTLTAAGGAGTQCGAFDVTLNVGYGEITASTIAGDQAICAGGDPDAFTEVSPASGSNTISYQWQSSTTDCNTGFQSIPGANGPTYDPPAGLDTTTYYRLIALVDASGCSSGLCRDTSNCITVLVTEIETPGLQNLTCNDNATPTIASDDYVTFSLNPVGDELPATYSLSVDNGGTITLLNGNPATNIPFGAATQFKLQNGSADGTIYNVTIDLNGSPNCPVTFPVSAASCSNDNVDLALIKTETSSGPYLPGDNVSFDVTVYNQGTLPVTNIQVTDYIPSGFIFNALDNPDFSLSAGNGIATIPNLAAGGNVTLEITLQIDPLFLGITLVNNAEITSYVGFADEDSTPGNNSGSMPELATDNDIDDDSPGSPGIADNPADEDDFDPAQINVLQSFDLALKKEVLTAGPVLPGTNVDYKVTVYNQGDIPASNITVTDYIPSGHNFNASDNADFALNGMVAEAIITALAPGDSIELSITLEVDLLFDAATIINNVEITAASGGTDEDSTPGNNSGSAPELSTDNDISDDSNGGADNPLDEDDFDPAEMAIFIPSDYGDLPATYLTLGSDNGPSHVLSQNLYLGTYVDGEADGQPEPMAGRMIDGDDNQNGIFSYGTSIDNDDEDGVSLLTPLVPGNTACLEITTHYDDGGTGDKAYLTAWIDWNGSGSFEPGEQLLFNQMMPAVTDAEVSAGDNTLPYCFDVPANATFLDGAVYMRVRLSTTQGLNYFGPAPDGEIEDYKIPLAKVGNYVWNDANLNGIQDDGAVGINGVGVELTWAGPDNDLNSVMDNITYSTTTDNMAGLAGGYMFSGLIVGTYSMSVPTPPASLTPTTVGAPTSTNFTDSDDPDGTTFVITDVETLPTGENGTTDNPGISGFPDNQEDLSFDFGYHTSCSINIQNLSASPCVNNRFVLDVTVEYESLAGDIEIIVNGRLYTFTKPNVTGTTTFQIPKLTCAPNYTINVEARSALDPSCLSGLFASFTAPCPDANCLEISTIKN